MTDKEKEHLENREARPRYKAPEALLKNRYKPGQSGNPNGRPKGQKDGLRAHLNRLLQTQAPDVVVDKLKAYGLKVNGRGRVTSNAAAIAGVVTLMAQQGNPETIKIIERQTEKPLAQSVEMKVEEIAPERKRFIDRVVGLAEAMDSDAGKN